MSRISRIFLVTILSLVKMLSPAQKVGIGAWDSYYTFTTVTDVVEGDQKVFWISNLSAMYYDMQDGSVQPFNKIQGLSETGLSKLGYNNVTKTMVFGYSDGNLDLLTFDANNKPRVVNMPDIKRSSITGDKSIYHLYSYNQLLYVSCGFGMVVIDLARAEVKDTYIIGTGGSQVKINGVAIGQDTIYATTDNGIYKAYQFNPFLNYYASWSKMTSLPAWLVSKSFKQPAWINNQLFVIPDYPGYGQDTAYYGNGSTWSKVPLLNGLDFLSVKGDASGNYTFSTRENVTQATPSFGVIKQLFSYAGSLNLFIENGIVASDGNFYTADLQRGPYKCIDSWQSQSLLPPGTKSSSVKKLTSNGKQLWVAPGQVSGTIFLNNYNQDFFSVKEGNTWTYIDKLTDPILDTNVYDILDVAIDPTDETHVMAAAWSFQGLVEIKDKKVVGFYDENNSILFSPAGYPGFCGVASVTYDKDGNLWCLNGASAEPLVYKGKDGTWKSFYCGPYANARTFYHMVIDESGLMYLPFPTTGSTAGGLLVYNTNGTPLDETDDHYYTYNTLAGQGHLPDGDVRCVTVDLDGQVWVGTVKGPAVIYNPSALFTSGTADAAQILIQQDGNTQILLETEVINCIEVDGANRKWFGTEDSGVYLISEDGQDQIEHFTIDNSPLPSNSIQDIEIDGKTGEVFFATNSGLVSYRGTATESQATFDNIKVFPNPVRPDYDGVIALNGISRNSDVKITDISGNIVNIVKSEGGQAIWNGKNLKGERVKSGVYLFLCSSEDGSNKVAGKVMFVE